ncbi:MAG: hypothetical protein NZ918_04360 [Aigarchaeota archaeon]|nr:hypothetical protein [Aigarchaeota archaeon]
MSNVRIRMRDLHIDFNSVDIIPNGLGLIYRHSSGSRARRTPEVAAKRIRKLLEKQAGTYPTI